MGKVSIGKDAKVNIKWHVLPIDRTDELEDEIISKFAKKYGIQKKNVSVEPVFINQSGEEGDLGYGMEVANNIQDPAFLQGLFKKYIAIRGIKDVDFDKIVEINDQISANINFESYEKHKKYAVKWIKWDNFMSYGPGNYFDFTGLKGLVLLSSEPANQGGKTTFCLDLLRFLLFGKVTSRETDWTIAKVFNRFLHDETEVKVEGCICIDGIDYVIKRTITRPAKRTEKSKVTQKIQYYRVDGGGYTELEDEDVENEAGTTATNTNKLIKEAIGNERDFDLMICVNDSNLKGLISLKDTDRGRLITRWIGLLPLEDMDKVARDTFNKTVQPSLYMNRYTKEGTKQTIEECIEENNELDKTKEETEKLKKASEEKLEAYKKTRDTLLESKRQIDDKLLNADVETVKNTLEQLKLAGQRKRKEQEENDAKLAELKDVKEFNEQNYKDKVAEDKKLTVELNNALNTYARIGKDIDALKSGEYCPTCGAKLKGVDNSKAIAEKQNERIKLQNDGKKLREKLNKITKEVEALEVHREQYNDKVRLELLRDKINVDIENLLSRHRENTRLLKDIKDNEEAIKKNNEIDTQLNIVGENIKVEERYERELSDKISECLSSKKANEKIISDSEKILEILEKEEVLVRNWKVYLEMIGKNGISKMVLRDALPLINGELKHLLNGVCDFTVEVAIDDHNDVAFYIISDGEKGSLGSGSGFEQTVASLALRSVLSKISSFSKPSFVVFDEILGGVSDENYDQVKLLYDKISADYSFILQITHLKQIADWHTKNIIVKKTNHVSRIETE